MSTGITSVRNESDHPFAGCARLLQQYRTVGAALLTYERELNAAFCPVLIPPARLERNFRTGVSFVGVEALESFLDDLLDLNVSDDSLFVKRPRVSKRAVALLVVLGVALGLAGLFGPSDTTGFVLPSAIFAVFMAGLSSALYFVPRTRVVRRFSFATVLSHEISRRRGDDRGASNRLSTRALISELLPTTRELTTGGRWSAEGAAQTNFSFQNVSRYYH